MIEPRELEIMKRKNVEIVTIGDTLKRKDTGEFGTVKNVLLPRDNVEGLLFYFKGYIVPSDLMLKFFEGAHEKLFCYV